MNPVSYIHDTLYPLIEASRTEIEGLRVQISNNEKEISELTQDNQKLSESLIKKDYLHSEAVKEVEAIKRVIGIEEPGSEEARMEDVARRLLESLRLGKTKIHELEENNKQSKQRIQQLEEQSRRLYVGLAGAGTVAAVATTYKIVKIFMGIKAGAVAGSQAGAAVGLAGGPAVAFTTTLMGGAIGGITGGVCSAISGSITFLP